MAVSTYFFYALNGKLNMYIDYAQMITMTIDCTTGQYAYKTISTVPSKTGYDFMGFLMQTGNAVGISPSYQSNSRDVWVYGRTTGKATVYCIPIFASK